MISAAPLLLPLVLGAMSAKEDEPQRNVLPVRDFGAVPNSGEDSGPGIRQAIEAARACKGPVTVKLESGTYRVGTPSGAQSALVLQGLKEVTVEGEGNSTEVILTSPRHGAFFLAECENVSVNDLVIDYDPVPFTQGTIEHANPEDGWFDLKLEEGYPSLSEPWFADAPKPYGQWGMIFDPVNRRLKRSAPDFIFIDRWKQTEEGLWRMYPVGDQKNRLDSMAKGDRFVHMARHSNGAAVFFWRSKQCATRNVTVYASPSLATAVVGSEDVVVEKLTVTWRPGTDRLLSTDADGAHCQQNLSGPTIEGCLFEGMADDSVNTYYPPNLVRKVLNDRELEITQGGEIREGDTVQVFDPLEGRVKGNAKVLEVEGLPGGVRKLLLDAPIRDMVAGDDSRSADSIYNLDRCGKGFVVRNNLFRNHRRHGMMIKSPEALIEGNMMEGLGGLGIVIGNDPHWPEGVSPWDVTVRNNTIKDCGRSMWYGTSPQGAAIQVVGLSFEGLARERLVGEILLEDTTCINPPGAALFIGSAHDVRVNGLDVVYEEDVPPARNTEAVIVENAGEVELLAIEVHSARPEIFEALRVADDVEFIRKEDVHFNSEVDGLTVPAARLDRLKPWDFEDDELDIPFYLSHFHRLANSIAMTEPNKGFITVPIWRPKKWNKPFNARVLENYFSMAYFYCTEANWNPYYGHPAVRVRLEALLDFWCRSQHEDGRFSEYGPNKWNLPATGFATMFMGQTLKLLDKGPSIDQSLHDRVLQAHRKACYALLARKDLFDHGKGCSNQYSGLWGGLMAFLEIHPDEELQTLLRKRLQDSLDQHQSPAGYWYESNGCDWIYTQRTHHGNLWMAWHYMKDTGFEENLVEGERRWAEWCAHNAMPGQDGKARIANRAIETRSRGEGRTRHNPMAEKVVLARAFAETQEERARNLAEKRRTLEATWPDVGELAVGESHAYSPHVLLNHFHRRWHPTEDQRTEAVGKLPCVIKTSFNHQRADDRSYQVFTFVRRPSYYAAFNAGQRLSGQQRFGLGFVWSEEGWLFLQSQTGSSDAAWGTRPEGAKNVLECELRGALFEVNGTKFTPKPGSKDLDEGDVLISYPLDSLGKKRVRFREDAIEVSIQMSGEFTEQIPLLTDGETLVRSSHQSRRERLQVGHQTEFGEVSRRTACMLHSDKAERGKRRLVRRMEASSRDLGEKIGLVIEGDRATLRGAVGVPSVHWEGAPEVKTEVVPRTVSEGTLTVLCLRSRGELDYSFEF